ncbi:MAG: hypothetical protein IJH38_04350 [Clostridia bacterium]|nr:hypothetical protein [Clostridia bacterium]
MTLKEHFLSLIGLEAMTNKDLLLCELGSLDGKTFEYMILSNMSDLPKLVEFAHCEDCRAAHGGQCPQPGDDECTYRVAQWLDEPTTREAILP